MTTKITEQNVSNLANTGVQWQAVKTSDFTAVSGEGYFVNTTSAEVTVTLPSSPAVGDTIMLKDYARTWGTNQCDIASFPRDGGTGTSVFSTNGQTVTLCYMDNTKGWSLINEDTSSDLDPPAQFIVATGGTVTTSGNYKIHSFTGDGTFTATQIGNVNLNPSGGPAKVSYIVVAGGGGGAAAHGGGGGAGGFREGKCSTDPYTASPLAATPCSGFAISVTTFPITVGAGGNTPPGPGGNPGTPGSNSVFSTITWIGSRFSTRWWRRKYTSCFSSTRKPRW